MLKEILNLYRAYGGISAIVVSPYLWIAVVFSAAVKNLGNAFLWKDFAIGTIPSLAGFTIAAFAIFLAVLSDGQRSALLKIRSGNFSPLVKLSSSIIHALIVQVLTLILAGATSAIDGRKVVEVFCDDPDMVVFTETIRTSFLPAFGTFLIFYSWLLLISVAISIFQFFILLQVKKTSPSKP